MPEYIKTDGSVRFDAGYTPATQQDPATKEYVDTALAALLDTTSDIPVLITNVADIPSGIAGRQFTFAIDFIGYDIEFETPVPGWTLTSKGVWSVPDPSPGSYNNSINLYRRVDGESQLYSSTEFTWSVIPASALTDAVITSTSLSGITYGQLARVPLLATGSEPYTVAITGGALPDGVTARQGFLTRADLAVSFVDGYADHEGPGGTVTVQLTGASGVPSAAVEFAAGIPVYRAPEIVGLANLGVFPENNPGAFDLAPFVRAYPAITGFTASPSLSSLHGNLGQSGLTITYGDLTTLSGKQVGPVTITLDDNGVGTPGDLVSMIQVSGAGTVPTTGTLATYDLSAFVAADGSEITVVPELAQGAAFPMSTLIQFSGATSGPTWNNSTKAAEFRAGDSIGIPVDPGNYPHAIGITADFKSTTGAGTREFMSSGSQKYLIDIGTAGGAAPVYLSSVKQANTGTRSSDDIAYSPSSAISALVVKVGYSDLNADRVSSVIVNPAGAAVAMTRATEAADTSGDFCRAFIYFLGSSIPAGALTVRVVYDVSHSTETWVCVEGYTADADVEVIDDGTPVVANTANPSITLDTTAGNRDCLATGLLVSGHASTGSVTSGGSQTRLQTHVLTNAPTIAIGGLSGLKLKSGTASSYSFTWTPGKDFAALVVVAAHGSSGTDRISSMEVDNGGSPVAMSRVQAASSGGTFPARRSYLYALTSSVPSSDTETLTFKATFDSSNGESIGFAAYGITSNYPVTVLDSDKVEASAGTDPSVTLTYSGSSAVTVGAVCTSLANLGDIVAVGAVTNGSQNDFGSTVFKSAYQTNRGTSDFTFGYTAASAQHALVAATFTETLPHSTAYSERQTTHSTSDFSFSWNATSEDCALCAITMSEIEGSGVVFSVKNTGSGVTTAVSDVLDTKNRYIFNVSGQNTGNFWKNNSKQALTPPGTGVLGASLGNLVLGSADAPDFDLYKIEVWGGALSDGAATAMDTRLNTPVTPPDVPVPPAPTNLVASGGDTVINLTWTSSPNASSYKIERSTVGSGNGFSEIATGNVPASYQDTGRTNGTTYYYRIRATNAGGDSPYSSEASATAQAQTPGAPANLTATAGNTTVTLAWGAVAGATYTVLRSTTQGSGHASIATGLTPTGYQDTGLSNGTTYYYVVRAVVNGTSSANSNEVSATPFSTTAQIRKKWAGFTSEQNADMDFPEHASNLKIEASGAGIQGRLFNAGNHQTQGAFYFKRVTKTIPHLGITVPMFEHTVWDTFPLYTVNNSIRTTLAAPYSSHPALGEKFYYAVAFMFDASLLTPPLLSGRDYGGPCGIHESSQSSRPAQTAHSSFIDPVSSTAAKIIIDIRSHDIDNAPAGHTGWSVMQSGSSPNILPERYYELYVEGKLGYKNSDGAYLRAWLWENGVAKGQWLNYSGRYGFHLLTHSMQMRVMSFYLWRGASQFQGFSANNLSGIPAGSKGVRWWIRKSVTGLEGTYGGITPTQALLLDYLRLVE